MKVIHIKIYCNACGKLLLHERVERKEGEQEHYIGLTVDPCEDCLATLLIEKDVGN